MAEKNMIIGYLDKKDKNIKIEEQENIISDYAQNHSMSVDLMLSAENIALLKEQVKTNNHTILIANVLALGDSLDQIIDNIESLNGKGHTIISVVEDFSIIPNQETRSIIKGLRLAYDIRSSLTSITTCKVLASKKAGGQKLGRAFGSTNRDSIQKKYKDIVLKALAEGRSKSSIARQLQISTRSVYNISKLGV